MMWFGKKYGRQMKQLEDTFLSKNYVTAVNQGRELLSKFENKNSDYFEAALIFSIAQFRVGQDSIALNKLTAELSNPSIGKGRNKKLIEYYSLFLIHYGCLLGDKEILQKVGEEFSFNTSLGRVYKALLLEDKTTLEKHLPLLEAELEDSWKYFKKSSLLLLLHKAYDLLHSSKSDSFYQKLLGEISNSKNLDYEDFKICQETLGLAEARGDFSTAYNCSETITMYLVKSMKSRQVICDWHLTTAKYAILCKKKSAVEKNILKAAEFSEREKLSIFEQFADRCSQSIRDESELMLEQAMDYYQKAFIMLGKKHRIREQIRVAQKAIKVTEELVARRLLECNLENYIVNDKVEEDRLDHLLATSGLLFNISKYVSFIEQNSDMRYERDYAAEGRKIWHQVLGNDFPKVTQKLQLGENEGDEFFFQKEDYERAAFLKYLLLNKNNLFNIFRLSLEMSSTVAEDYLMSYSGAELAVWMSDTSARDDGSVYEILTSRAWDYFRNGDYVKAKYLFDYWFRYKVNKVGFFHESNEFSLKGLVRSSRRLGLFDQAIYYCEMRKLLAKQMKNTWDFNEVCVLLAGIYLEMGDYEKARSALHDGAVAYDVNTGAINLGYNWSMETYALLEILEGHFESARSKILKELEKSAEEDKIQRNAGFLGRSYAVQGRLYNAQGDYKRALESFKKSFEHYSIRHKDSAPELERLYTHLLATFINLGDEQDLNYAVEMIHHAFNYVINRCVAAFEILDEDSRYHYLRVCRHIISLCHTFVVQHPYTFSSQEIAQLSLVMKNICSEATYFHINQIEHLPDDYREIYNEWLELREQEMVDYPQWSPNVLLTVEGNRKFELEYKLLSLINRSNQEGLIKKFNLEEITASLAEDEVILEYGSFYHSNGKFNENNCFYNDIGLPPKENFKYGNYYYVAAITGTKVDVYYLDFSKKIDKTIDCLIEKISKVEGYQAEIDYLRGKLLNPVLEHLSGSFQKVYIVPDANLYRLPFELLLPDKLNLMGYLSTSRNTLDREKKLDIQSVSVFANPEFYRVEKDTIQEVKTVRRDIGEVLRPENIHSLPWTEEEQKAIQEICMERGIECLSFMGNKATKTLFEDTRSQMIHVATHAFAVEKSDTGLENYYLPLKSLLNPMKRSGLLLAGVSNILKGESLPEEYGDGIVTAHDILTMNLKETSLVILSACQSGLGNRLSGEGIQGFRKAFELSGVQYLICTLWEVEDFATMVFMKMFYKNLFIDKDLDIKEAFQKTKLEMSTRSREQLLSLEVSEDELDSRWHDDPNSIFAHPYWWAGFVLQIVGK